MQRATPRFVLQRAFQCAQSRHAAVRDLQADICFADDERQRVFCLQRIGRETETHWFQFGCRQNFFQRCQVRMRNRCEENVFFVSGERCARITDLQRRYIGMKTAFCFQLQ